MPGTGTASRSLSRNVAERVNNILILKLLLPSISICPKADPASLTFFPNYLLEITSLAGTQSYLPPISLCLAVYLSS